MKCPYCQYVKTLVIRTEKIDGYTIKRTRKCQKCEIINISYEKIEENAISSNLAEKKEAKFGKI